MATKKTSNKAAKSKSTAKSKGAQKSKSVPEKASAPKASESKLPNLKLSPSLDIVSVADLKKGLSSLLESSPLDNFELDGSEVEKITTPCIQLLISFDKAAVEAGKKVSLKAPSEVMQRALSDIGLQNKLDEWSNAK